MKPWQEAKMEKNLWDTILLWSSYDVYRSVKEIATCLGISRRTVESRIRRFEKKNPEAYQKIMSDRAAIKATTIRLGKELLHPVPYDNSMESFIKEKF